jgi:hypothetical protein
MEFCYLELTGPFQTAAMGSSDALTLQRDKAFTFRPQFQLSRG